MQVIKALKFVNNIYLSLFNTKYNLTRTIINFNNSKIFDFKITNFLSLKNLF